MSTDNFGYTLRAWQEDDMIPSNMSELTNLIVFELRVNFPQQGEGLHLEKRFTVRRDCMADEDHAQLHIVDVLSQVGIFTYTNSSIATAIYRNIVAIANWPDNIASPKILPIVFEIELSWLLRADNNDDDDNNNNNHPMMPAVPAATEASTRGLENVELKDVDSADECMICLEELSTGLALGGITRTPCSHLYHHNCIVQWLQRSNLCPLCRSEVPLASIL